MPRWEYRVVILQHRDGTHSSQIHVHPEDFVAALNPLGAEGWEIFWISGSIVHLRRELAAEA